MSLVPRISTLALGLLVAAATLVPGGPGHAQTVEGSIFAGGAFMTSDLSDEFIVDTGSRLERASQSHDNGLALGARVGLRWTALSLEGAITVVPTKLVTRLETSPNVSDDQTILILGGNALYSFTSGRFLELFVTAGGGVKSYSADDPGGGFDSGIDAMVNFGGGAHLFVTPNMAIRVDLRDYVSSFDAFANIPGSDQEAKTQHDILLTLGLSYRRAGGR